MKQKHLIVGAGEVGTALHLILKRHYPIALRDKDGNLEGRFDVLHVAYPVGLRNTPHTKAKLGTGQAKRIRIYENTNRAKSNFVKITKDYIKQYQPKLVIIHSTVPVGTTRRIGKLAVHSPIRGVHPHLEKGIRTFVKYFGGPKAGQAAKIFSDIGVKVKTFKKAETTELLKILDTTYYGWNIVFAKEVKRICDKFGLDFDEVYTIPNCDYNEGYRKLGKPHVVRPVLKDIPGKIGGHCLIPNCDLLDDWVTRAIKERNKKY